MDIVPSPEFRADLIKRIAEREFKVRTGVHCSDLVYCLNKQALRRNKPLPIDDATLLLFSLGWSTQRWLTGEQEDEPEKEVDGIIVTCDELTEDGVPWECKATFASSERPISDSHSWLRQCMAQCHVNGKKTAFLSRFELMGNWKSIFGKKEEKALPENRKPTLSAFQLTFTQEELERNWEWLCERRDLFQALLDGGKLLPKVVAIPSGNDWECSFCNYRGAGCSL